MISDATVSADILAIQEAGDRHRIPNFTGVVSGVRRGALAAFGVDDFLAGYAAGKKAALVLRGVNPVQIPWNLLLTKYKTNLYSCLNGWRCAAFSHGDRDEDSCTARRWHRS